jgi:UDP-N-acetyl-D-mannosaminuronate dehydrogenase
MGKALGKQKVDEVLSVGFAVLSEMSKPFKNIQRAVNIGLFNEIKASAGNVGIDIYELIDADDIESRYGYIVS